MRNEVYDLAIFIGRFQPFHLGHRHAVQRGMAIANHVLILAGSDHQPRTIQNPWTVDERRQMIWASMPADVVSAPDCAPRVIVRGIDDYPYNDQQWISSVQAAVADVADELYLGPNAKIVLIGHEKDESSFYLRFFPQWKFLDTGYEEFEGAYERRIDATKIREFYFENQFQYTVGVVSREVRSILSYLEVNKHEEFEALRKQWEYVKGYKKAWAAAPYEPTFVTCDAVVIQSGHVLVVERGDHPGKGLLALPGGFLNPNERVEAGAIRELVEETEIKLQPDVLRRCIKHVEVFDHPQRSLRGRTITHAFLFKLNDTVPLPKVRGSDDAAHAFWLPISELDSTKFFEDHYHIIQSMIGKL
jgi:bifunctional NMN adenylyltransferase/nudix hydrolase